ncbi:MAG TPA: DUF2274 domain-containing protein [Rhizomicrobium sp.]|jgi:hypothetical protein
MPKLKLAALPDDKPVKHAITLSGTVNRDLLAYAELMGRDSGTGPVELEKIIPRMIERFMATDRGFARARKTPKSTQTP